MGTGRGGCRRLEHEVGYGGGAFAGPHGIDSVLNSDDSCARQIAMRTGRPYLGQMTDPGPEPRNLTAREQEIYALAARGLSNAEIAREAFISEATVKTHMRHIMAKLGVTSRSRLAAMAHTRTAGGAARRTNGLAIIALIAAFVVPLAGIICGHIALGQIKDSGGSGRRLALWGTVLGYVFSLLYISIYVVAAVLYLPALIAGP